MYDDGSNGNDNNDDIGDHVDERWYEQNKYMSTKIMRLVMILAKHWWAIGQIKKYNPNIDLANETVLTVWIVNDLTEDQNNDV